MMGITPETIASILHRRVRAPAAHGSQESNRESRAAGHTIHQANPKIEEYVWQNIV